MSDTRLTTLAEHTHSRADFAYRIGVLKEFLAFTFFTVHQDRVTKEVVDAFEKEKHPVADIAFLRSLSEAFFEGFTQDSFNEELNHLSEAAQKLPMLSLTLPIMLDDENKAAVWAWVRKELGNDVMLDISSDTEIAVGCQIVWRDQLHDFGFDHYLDVNREKIEEGIARVVPRAPLLGRL